jgi:hypothetical protein
MAGLLSGGKALKGTAGSTSIFITLPTAQLNLGTTPTTGTGYTLVTGASGQLVFTSTIGSVRFTDAVIQANNSNSNLVIQSTGTGTLSLNGNVIFNGQSLNSILSSLTNVLSQNITATNLTVTGLARFTAATLTATFAGGVLISKDLRVDQQFNAYGNVSLSPEGGIVDIRPTFGGTVLIGPGDTGRIDNMYIGGITPADGRFVNLTATNFTVENFQADNQNATTGTFQFLRVTSTLTNAATVAGSLKAGQLYDSNIRVIREIFGGTDTAVVTTAGSVKIWSTATIQSITDRGTTTTNFLHIKNGFSQVGTGTGILGGTWTESVLKVDGDVGVGGNLYVNGDFFANGRSVLTTGTIGGSLNQGIDITITDTGAGGLRFDDVSTLQSVTGRGNTTTNRVLVLNTSNSTSTTTGAITVAGGVGIGKDVNIGGAVYAQVGGSPAYNYQLYTPQVTVSTSTPASARIGDFWIDPSIGVEYQYVPNGTDTVWIQFIGF